MANYFARKAGNINATDVWATTPTGTAADVWSTFTTADVLHSNNFAITVNVSTTVGEVRNTSTNGATAGGSFALSDEVTLTANSFSGTATCVTYSGTSGNSANFVGNVLGGNGTGPHGISNLSTGTLNITGNVTAATGNHGGANNASTGTINITGNAFGGSSGISNGVINASTGTINITGNVNGGLGASTGVGAFQNSTGTLSIIGTVTASHTAAGVAGASTQQVTILSGPFITETTRGVAPVYCAAWRWNASPSNSTYMEIMTNNLLAKRNLVTDDNVTGMPSVSNVRSGTVYGPTSALTGTLVVPAAGSVALGVPVDNTTGTAVLTPAAVWNHATRTITGGLVDTATTLTNAPTVPTASQIASAVWEKPTTELTITGSIGERAKNQSTVSTTGAQLAAALS
jgi:hypothetical protein